MADSKLRIVGLDVASIKDESPLWHSFAQFGDSVFYDYTRPEQAVERSRDADIIMLSKVPITRECFQQLPRLKFICVTATGYNIVDIAAAREYGVTVSNVPAYSTMSVAQMVFAHLLNITNRVNDYASQNREGMWNRQEDFCYRNLPLHELDGKTMCVIGMGSIGTAVSRIAQAFGMQVVAVSSKASESLPVGIVKMQINEALACADVVTIHCPQTPQNVKMFNAELLGRMKKNSILINTARGGLIDEEAVADALRSGRLGAYAADVVSVEPPSDANPLIAAPNAYLTPHVAWSTDEARTRLLTVCYDNIKNFIKNHPINIVT